MLAFPEYIHFTRRDLVEKMNGKKIELSPAGYAGEGGEPWKNVPYVLGSMTIPEPEAIWLDA
jgi:hypothetical protein